MYQPRKIFWEDKYSTGDENIDFQHKYLFETFNKLGEAIEQGGNEKNISLILGRLRFYSDWHFAKEEECMARHQCPAAEKNRKAHEAFRELILAYSEEYVNTGGSRELALRVHESLSHWLTEHILAVDTSLRGCVRKKD